MKNNGVSNGTETVHLKDSGAAVINANSVDIRDGGAMLIKGNTISIQEGGAAVMSAQSVRLQEGGSGLIIARQIDVIGGRVGVAIANHFNGPSQLAIDVRAAVVLGAVAGLALIGIRLFLFNRNSR
ncbi:MAG: hypothetical protein H6631_04970 [Anaerolineaceae bacterium]|nr:hypothetical protein [Anaerolineaceae bacterium]MCB9101263.1 hypothetical protein [Anaerolineales bacterium]